MPSSLDHLFILCFRFCLFSVKFFHYFIMRVPPLLHNFTMFHLYFILKVFTFKHPNFTPTKSNQRYKKLCFELPADTGSAIVHGMSVLTVQLFLFKFKSYFPSVATEASHQQIYSCVFNFPVFNFLTKTIPTNI